MNFEWSTNDLAIMTLTVYETNLTLNKAACYYFEDVNYVLLGIDKEKKQIGIKPISKQEIDDHIYPTNQLHRISLGKSYGRISNKSFVYDLCQNFGFNFQANPYYKYKASYDVIHGVMIIQL